MSTGPAFLLLIRGRHAEHARSPRTRSRRATQAHRPPPVPAPGMMLPNQSPEGVSLPRQLDAKRVRRGAGPAQGPMERRGGRASRHMPFLRVGRGRGSGDGSERGKRRKDPRPGGAQGHPGGAAGAARGREGNPGEGAQVSHRLRSSRQGKPDRRFSGPRCRLACWEWPGL